MFRFAKPYNSRDLIVAFCVMSACFLEVSRAQDKAGQLGVEKLPKLEQTRVAGRVESRVIDPGMTAQEELEINEFLLRHDASDWNGLTLRELREHLSAHVPVYFDREAMRDIGVDFDATIAQQLPALSVDARLTVVLPKLRLTHEVRHGCLVITSLDEADCECGLRIYDVKPLVKSLRYVPTGKESLPAEGTLSEEEEACQLGLSGLVDVIAETIDPDGWLMNGGCATMKSLQTESRAYLVVYAPRYTQIKIQRFLDVLNSSEPLEE